MAARAATVVVAAMTERRLHSSWTTTAAIGIFVALITLLAVQMRVGRDPALGVARKPPVPVAVAQVAPRRVLIKRVVRRVIDEVVIQDARPSARVSAPATDVVTAASAVVQPTYTPAAPVYVAPAPAPIVTRTS